MAEETRTSNLTRDLEAALGLLSKAVLSQPIAPELDSRVDIRPLKLRGRDLYQIERFRDSKAFHQNVDGEELLRIFARELDGRYRQALLVSGGESVQYSLRRSGLYKRSGRAAVPAPGGGAGSHNREKEYILREGENIPALVDLGVFTPDFHIVKAKYDKYKQINRFVELVDQDLAGRERRPWTIRTSAAANPT